MRKANQRNGMFGSSKSKQLMHGGRNPQGKPSISNWIKELDKNKLTVKDVKQLLHSTFEHRQSSVEDPKISEDFLTTQMQSNPKDLISLLIQIICEPVNSTQPQMNPGSSHPFAEAETQERSRNQQMMIKEAAAAQLGRINRAPYILKKINQNEITVFIQGFMIILSSDHEFNSVFKHISVIMKLMLKAQTAEFKSSIFNNIRELLMHDNSSRQLGGLLSLEAMMESNISEAQTVGMIEQFLDRIFDISQMFYQQATNEMIEEARIRSPFPNTSNREEPNIDRFNVKSEALLSSLRRIELWCRTVNNLFIRLQKLKQSVCNSISAQILSNTKIFVALKYLIEMQLQVQEQPKGCLVSFSSSYDIDQQINVNLVSSLKIIVKLIKLLLRHKLQDLTLPTHLQESAFCQFLKVLIPSTVSSLRGLHQFLTTYKEFYDDFKVDQIKTEFLSILKQSLKIVELGPYFFEQRVSFICSYVTPLLKGSDNDFLDFERFGLSHLQQINQFRNLDDNTVNQISAAKLMLKYCKHVHGATTFFVTFFLEKIHSILHNIPVNSPEFEVLGQSQGSILNENVFKPSQQINMSLNALFTLRKLIRERSDLIAKIDGFLISNLNVFSETQLNLEWAFLLSQVFMLINELVDKILLNNRQVFIAYMQFMLQCLQKVNFSDGFPQQVYMIIYEMVSRKTASEQIRPIAQIIYYVVIGEIQKQKSEVYFDALNALVHKFKEEIFAAPGLVITLIGILIGKIFSSCADSKTKQKAHLDGVKFSFMLLEVIIQWENLSVEAIQEIELALQPLYNILSTALEHDLSNKVSKLMRIQLTRIGGIQTQQQYQNLALLNAAFAPPNTDPLISFELFKIINLVITKQPALPQNDPLVFQFFLEVGLKGMCTKNRFSYEFDRSLGCLILQLLIHNYNTLIPKETYVSIIEKSIEGIRSRVRDEYFEARLMEVLFSCIEIDIESTFYCMMEKKFLETFSNCLLKKTGIFKEMYEKKLYIVGCSRMLKSCQLVPFVQQNLAQILSRTIRMLESIQDQSKLQDYQRDFKSNQSKSKDPKSSDEEKTKGSDSDEDSNKSDCDSYYNEEEKDEGEDYDDNEDEDDSGRKRIKGENHQGKKKGQLMLCNGSEMEIMESQNVKKQRAKTFLNRGDNSDDEDADSVSQLTKASNGVQKKTDVDTLVQDKIDKKQFRIIRQDSEDSFKDLRKEKRAQKSLFILNSPLNKLDEFTLFQQSFNEMKQILNANGLQMLLSSIEPSEIKLLQELLVTKRVVSNDSAANSDQTQVRKIFKLKRKPSEQVPQMNPVNNNNNQANPI